MKRHRGFTLSEIIVVAALFLILGGGILTAFLTGQTSYFSADSYVQVQQEARRAFDYMVRELRESGNISCGAAAGGCATPATPSTRLNFQIALGYFSSAATSPCGTVGVCYGNEAAANQWVHYVISGTGVTGNDTLYRCLTPGQYDVIASYVGCRVLANNVNGTNSSFLWDPAASVRSVTMNLQTRYQNTRIAGGSQQTGVLTTRVRLRNN